MTTALAFCVMIYPRPFLAPLGRYLVDAEPPTKCDCLFVLGGDFNGQRILEAAKLYRQGLAGKIVVSGPLGIYGRSEDELAIAFAKQNGAEDVPFLPMPHNASSTLTEGRAVHARMAEAGCRSVLVVTSNYHTRRAGRILRRVWPDIQVRMAAAPSLDFDPENWWTERRYQKTLFYEWSKTVADWIGL